MMRFKILGVALLGLAVLLAVRGFALALEAESPTAESYLLMAIFLAVTVRVLQAEKHHRDRLARENREVLEDDEEGERTAML